MLKKVIRHEWKETAKIGLLLLAVILIVTLLGGIGFVLPLHFVVGIDFDNDAALGGIIWMLVMFSSLMIYIFTLMGVMYGMLIYLGVRFYKTMYGAEGYLTHTLPVKPWQLLFGKTLVSGLWYMLLGLCMVLSFLILAGACLFSIAEGVPGLYLEDVWYVFEETLDSLPGSQVAGVVHYFVSLFFTMLVIPFSTTMLLFGSLTIGQLSKKYKAVMGILTYFGVCMINGMLGYVVSMIQSVSMIIASEEYFGVSAGLSMDLTVIVQACLSVGMFFLSKHILTNKLNME